jgi:dihydrodipicolinate synthase/N-acetylneuraminate lyase
MLTMSDVRGVCAFVPTPVTRGAAIGDLASSVDLQASTEMVERLIGDGVSMLALCGTTGEGAALLWDEKREYVAAVVEQTAGRIPLFAGAISLGTRETIRQMREFEELGVDGAIVCPPFWQTPTLENAVRFIDDISQAVPRLPTMVYSNKFFFKFEFPTEFWRRAASDSSTVIATKVSYDFRPEDYEAAGQRIKFMGGEGNFRAVHDTLSKEANAAWCTSAAMGPEPWLALVAAVESGDAGRANEVLKDIESVPPPLPMDEFHLFSSYNVQLEKVRIDAAGYVHCGPARAPYTDLPDNWREAAERNGKAWAELSARYRNGA